MKQGVWSYGQHSMTASRHCEENTAIYLLVKC